MAKVTFTIHKAGKHQRHSRRNQILDAAQRCFKKQGFHKTTLRDIAQEFGMSAGHIYNYFSNKEAIIEALVELRTQEFLDMIDTDKFADLPPEERMDKELGQVVDAYLNLDNTSLSIAIMNEALINPKVYEIVVAAASKVRNHIVPRDERGAPLRTALRSDREPLHDHPRHARRPAPRAHLHARNGRAARA